MDVNEFNIIVPWGHISAKAWGKESSYPVLCVHGRQDNAGSFDRLIPLLPNYFYYLSFDLPGHGMSSHYPPGFMPTYYDFMRAVQRVIEYVGLKKFIYLGHSLGGRLGLHLRAIYPENITKLIMLDILDAENIPPKQYGEWFRAHYDMSIKIETKSLGVPAPRYKYEDIILLLNQNRHIEPEAANCLLKRCTIPNADGTFCLSMDQKNKAIQIPLMDESYRLEAVVPKYPFPLLIIIANQSLKSGIKVHIPLLNALKKNSQCLVTFVDGTHDVHNNTPEKVAPIITKFLTRTQSSL